MKTLVIIVMIPVIVLGFVWEALTHAFLLGRVLCNKWMDDE